MRMKELTSIKTMSSREIAELTGKSHFHVLRDIKSLIKSAEFGASNFGLSSYESTQGKTLTQYNLDKELTFTLVSGYETKLRRKIVARWLELEEPSRRPIDMTILTGLLALYKEHLPSLSQNSLQSILSIATKEMTGVELLPLPIIKEKRYTVTEMAEFFGVSRQKLGKIISELDIRKEPYAERRLSKSEYSDKQVEQCFYSQEGFDILKSKLNQC